MTRSEIKNIRPVRNMFKRYGFDAVSLESVYSEYEIGGFVRRVTARFTDEEEARAIFEGMSQTREEDPIEVKLHNQPCCDHFDIIITHTERSDRDEGSL